MTEEGKIMMKNYLSHHGIQGQHWGVKNGPPYPLKPEVSKKVQKKGAEEKAYRAKREKLKKGDKRVKSVGISHEYSKRDKQLQTVGVHPKNVTFYADDGWTSTKSEDSYNTISNELAGMDTKTAKRVFGFGDTIGNGGKTNYTDYFNSNISEVANKVNSYYDPYFRTRKSRFGQPGYTNNCSKCSTAFEMQRRGYDVMAGGSLHGNLSTAAEYWWDGAKTYKEHSNTIDDRIQKFGRNGSGTISIRYSSGGGHEFNFTTDRKSGVTTYVDTQSGHGAIGHSWDDVKKFFGGNIDDNQFIRVTRLDTATPNFKHMAEDDVLDYSDGRLNQNGWVRRIVDTSNKSSGGGYRSYERW